MFIVHHSVAKATESPSHFIFAVPAFKANTYKIQQHTHKCEQTYAQRINDHQARAKYNQFKGERVRLCLTIQQTSFGD